MLAHQSTLKVVGAQLQHILASIQASLQRNMPQTPSTPTATTTAVPATADADHLLVHLVLRLTVEAPEGLHVYLRDVEPLLALPALEAACRFVLRIASV